MAWSSRCPKSRSEHLAGAPRNPSRPWGAVARGAGLMLGLWLAAAGPALADRILAAEYGDPTGRYAHGVLGDELEWGSLELRLADGSVRRFVLDESLVFEDLAPRLYDVDGVAGPEVIVVESHVDAGARLAVWGPEGRIAATPFIGRPFRWLAPVAAGDLDGDGRVEIAYVDRPHLARVLRVWRFEGGTLREIASFEGVSNHRIGWARIVGGLRACEVGPELVLPSGDWQDVLALRLVDGQVRARRIGAYSERALDAAMACD